MRNLFEQIKVLHDQELHSNVTRLGSLAITICEQKAELITPIVKFNFFIQYGNSLFSLQQYRTAEKMYSQALQLKKTILKQKSSQKLSDIEKDLLPDTEIKYKLYLCYVKLDKFQKAVEILQNVSPRTRTAKINMALGNLYREVGMERSAIVSYKEVLRECPLALEAAEGLLSLGINCSEVSALMVDATCDVATTGWVNSWIRGKAQFYARDYDGAVSYFKSLDKPGFLRSNVPLLVTIGQCHYYNGLNNAALSVLQRAYSLDPNMQQGLDILAALLAKNNHKDLEKLLPPDLDLNQYTSEHWVALAYCMFASKKYARAAYLVQKACQLGSRNVEALLLKSMILFELKKFSDARSLYREILQISPYRYEAHKGLVDCYVQMNRIREALTVANNSYKQLGQNPRAITLYASVLMKDPLTISRAKSLLQRALSMDMSYLPAVYLLTEIYEQEMNLEKAAQLLTKHANLYPNSKLNQMLGDVHVRLHNDEKAFQHYTIALKLDPNNRRAQEGMSVIGRSKLDSSYYLPAGSDQSTAGQNSGFSDQEPEFEVLSLFDQWPHMEMQNSFQ